MAAAPGAKPGFWLGGQLGVGAAVCTAADIARLLQYHAQQPDDGLLQLLTLLGRRGAGDEGIFLVPSRVPQWELKLLR